jgi:hypothetical protein
MTTLADAYRAKMHSTSSLLEIKKGQVNKRYSAVKTQIEKGEIKSIEDLKAKAGAALTAFSDAQKKDLKKALMGKVDGLDEKNLDAAFSGAGGESGEASENKEEVGGKYAELSNKLAEQEDIKRAEVTPKEINTILEFLGGLKSLKIKS